MVVPMLKEGRPVGAISIYRPVVQPFTQKQIELVSTFANQAVIAIENARLFKELQAQTEALSRSVGQLTALGEVGQAVSSTLDLETVLTTIVSRARHLLGVDGGAIYEYDEATEEFQLRATENFDEEFVEALRATPIRLGEGAVGRTGAGARGHPDPGHPRRGLPEPAPRRAGAIGTARPPGGARCFARSTSSGRSP